MPRGRVAKSIQENRFAAENGRHGKQVEPALENAEADRRIARILIDLFPAGFALFLKFFQRRPNAGQELENNGGGDVRHDSQTENRNLTNIRGTEHRGLVQQRLKRVVSTGSVSNLNLIRVHHRKVNLVTNTENRQKEQGQKDLAAKFRNGKDDSNLLEHE